MSVTDEAPEDTATETLPLDDRLKELTIEQRLDFWKVCVESVDRLSQRRMLANGFFLTISTFLLTATFLPNQRPSKAVIGAMLSILWILSIKNFLSLSKAKFEVIKEIEKALPYSPFIVEWQNAREGSILTKYFSVSCLEMVVAAGFFVVHIIAAFI